MVKARTGDAHALGQTVKPSPKICSNRFEIETQWDTGTAEKFVDVGYSLNLIQGTLLQRRPSLPPAGGLADVARTGPHKTSQHALNCCCHDYKRGPS
jgi:hypothetical protein